MKIIIAGTRYLTNYDDLTIAINTCDFTEAMTEVVSGAAPGIDTLGEQFAKTFGFPCKRFPAKWKEYGKGAGFIRNEEMAKYADGLIAVWDGKSSGTWDMICRARSYKLQIHIHKVKV